MGKPVSLCYGKLVMEEKKKKIYTGIALDRDVAEYLAAQAVDSRCSRSHLINFIVRTYVMRPGVFAQLKIAAIIKESSSHRA